jgi:hypothetical protein
MPTTPGKHRVLHASPPSARSSPTPEGRSRQELGTMCAGRSRGALRFLSWLAGVPMQGAPPLRCGVRREGGFRAGGGSKGHQDSLLRALCRIRRSHMVPNLIRGCLRALNKPRCGVQWGFQGAAGSARTTMDIPSSPSIGVLPHSHACPRQPVRAGLAGCSRPVGRDILISSHAKANLPRMEPSRPTWFLPATPQRSTCSRLPSNTVQFDTTPIVPPVWWPSC